MQPEVKALKEVVERFGTMMQQLSQDYIKFKDWFDKVVESDDFVKSMKEYEPSAQVEAEYQAIKVTRKRNKEDVASMLSGIDNFSWLKDENGQQGNGNNGDESEASQSELPPDEQANEST